ncbi:MAG: DUF1624 domain-containing protein [Leptothrix sp. (in: b-proteobacteria)]
MSTGRLDRLDALRGAAMVWMTLFHAAFDLNQHGLIAPQNFYLDPFWTVQRLCIVSLFLLCAGAGQAVAQLQAVSWPRFWRRWAQVLGCALLVSAGSAWMFPQSWISFGVLHGLAVMTLLARLMARWPARAWIALALAAMLLPWIATHPVFDSRWTNWVGLVTFKPRTEDYVPLLPWLGVLMLGGVAGRWLLRQEGGAPGGWLRGGLARGLQPLAWLGRHALSYYMLHQPVLIGLCLAWVTWHAR